MRGQRITLPTVVRDGRSHAGRGLAAATREAGAGADGPGIAVAVEMRVQVVKVVGVGFADFVAVFHVVVVPAEHLARLEPGQPFAAVEVEEADGEDAAGY